MKRWLTALIAVPLLFGVVAYGGPGAFAVLVIAVSLLGMHEYGRIALRNHSRMERALTMAGALLVLLAATSGGREQLLAAFALSLIAVLILNLLRMKKPGADMAAAGASVLGLAYVPLLMAHLILIRQTPSGVVWIFFILVLAFSGDVAAYYAGRRFGRRKLLAEVSPGKTVEGTVALVAGSVAGCLAFRQLFFPGLAVADAALLGFVGSVIGQLGDLCESALKRTAGIKDSGAILPGHGGVLDRLDCLMFIAPFVYHYQEVILR